MRVRFYKDPAMIGKLSNKRLDLSFNLQQEREEQLASAILPAIHSKESLGKKQQSKKGLKMEKKSSIINNFEEEGDEPLPQIRISFSKLYELRRVFKKNPQEQGPLLQSQYRGAQLTRKQSDLVGHLYSPRSQSVVEPGFIRHQKVKSSRRNLSKNGNRSRMKFGDPGNVDFLDHLRQNKQVKVKMVDYNKKFNQSGDLSDVFKRQKTQIMLSSSRDVFQHSKQQSTQSRVVPMELRCSSEEGSKEKEQIKTVVEEAKLVSDDKKLKKYLKDRGNLGYFQIQTENHQQQSYDQLSFLWQENYIEPKATELVKPTFFLQEQEGSIINTISLETSISQIKIMLIEQTTSYKVSFNFPGILLNTITEDISQVEVHGYAQKVFSLLRDNFRPQLISFTKYSNCILITTKITNSKKNSLVNKLALLWYFSGRFYVGEWSDNQHSQGSFGCKQGLGFQFFPSNYVYYGNFNKNWREGFGIMKKHSKEVYIGEWSSNKRSGWGKVYDGSGQLVFDGDFEEGRFKEDRLHKFQG